MPLYNKDRKKASPSWPGKEKNTMKKEMRMIERKEEKLLRKDWYALGSRAGYWNGSPWRAIGDLLRR